VPQQPGTYVFSTAVTDIWGNTSEDYDAVNLAESLTP
jgi:hypothetical protein